MSKLGLFLSVLPVATAYYVGWQHGESRGALSVPRPETVVAHYPFASACAEMLEVAWSVDRQMSLSPHKP